MSLDDFIKNHDQLTEEIKKLEAQLKEKNSELRNLTDEIMVDHLAEMGIDKGSMSDGRSFKVHTEFYPSIKDTDSFISYLRRSDALGILKTEFRVQSSFDEAQRIEGKFEGLDYKTKSSVHPQTLKAFVKERFGEDMPGLDVYVRKSVKIK